MNTKWREWFGWSKSRQELWDGCRRQYYYQYIGKHEGNQQAIVIKRLSRLTVLPFWRGKLIHDAVAMLIGTRSEESLGDQQKAKSYARIHIRKLQHQPEAVLAEANNGFRIADEYYQILYEDISHQIDVFCTTVWPRYTDRKILHRDVGSLGFKPTSFEWDGLRIWVSPDLVTSLPDASIVITDWKTGRSEWEDAASSQQITCYIGWAVSELGGTLETTRGELVFLRTGEIQEAGRTRSQLDDFQNYVRVQTEEMLRVSHPDDMPASPDQRRCPRCPFAIICHEGREILKAALVFSPAIYPPDIESS
jgi:hypothetical protein